MIVETEVIKDSEGVAITCDPLTDLLQDWAPGRDQEEYVFRYKKGTSWKRKQEGGYSKYISGKLTSLKDLLKKAYTLCQNRINTMTSGRGKHHLSFHPSKNFTDGITVHVSTEAADEKTLTVFEILDIMIGASTHETAHILYTDFTMDAKTKFAFTCLNIIEDERIEKLTCERWPGFSVFIQAIKRYYFDFKYSRKNFSSASEEIFDCFFKLIRYPKHLDIELVEKHYSFLREIKSFLTPYPETFDAAYSSAHKIAELFKDKLGEFPKTENDSGENLTPQEIDKLLDSISDQMADLRSANLNKDETKVSKSIEDIVDALEAHGQTVSYGNTIFERADTNAAYHAELRNEMLPAARQLSRLLFSGHTHTVLKETGLLGGTLDENRIADMIAGCQTPYFQNQIIEKEDLVLAVMTDESGSMRGQKINDAMRCSITISESLKSKPTALKFFYGYTSDHYRDNDNVITVYTEPGFSNPATLGSMSAKSSNCDSECILAVANRVREFTAKKCLLIVISDGMPVSRDGTVERGITDTQSAVEQISKQGFVPIQIGIGTKPEDQQKMFKHFVTFQDSAQLVKDLRKVLPKAIAVLKKAR